MHSSALRAAVHIAAVFAFYLALFMLLPAAVDFAVSNDDWVVFAVSAGMTAGTALTVAAATRDRQPKLSPRLVFLVVNILWLTLSVAGALPFYFASLKLDFADSLFESVSAITTTGSTVIVGLDEAPPGILLWRSLLQWIGGLGVIALGLFMLPFLNIGGFAFFRIESSEKADLPFARFRVYARTLVIVYVMLTAVCAILYAMAEMTPFDAVNHAMTTLSTGGFSTHDASFGHFGNSATLWIAIAFMAIGGMPFSAYMFFVVRSAVPKPLAEQMVYFIAIVFIIGMAVFLSYLPRQEMSDFGAFTHSIFNIMSVVTTTGYASADYSLWGPFALSVFFIATFIGGCSGSTAGGVKIYRWMVLFRSVNRGLYRLVFPHAVQPIRMGGEPAPEDMQASVMLFVVAFFVIWGVSIPLLGLTGLDLTTSVTGALTALCNVGPGLGDIIGPAGNFSTLPDSAKWILSLLMLLGRLEILTVLVLFSPFFWRE